MIKLFKPFISQESKELVQKVLNSDEIAEGKIVKQFENEFSTTFNKCNVVALNSGTSALELAYEILGIGEGDEVITPVLTCTATNIPLVRRRAKIIFADINYDLNINIEDVIQKITPKTKAIVFVHFGGNNRGLKELVDLCGRHNIALIEDAAQAVGSDYWGYGRFACVSFQAIKTITTGDGGAIVCNSESDFVLSRKLRWFGYDRDEKQRRGDTDLRDAGFKYHMNNVAAAIGLGNIRAYREIECHMENLKVIYQRHGLFAHSWLAGGFTDRYDEFKKYMSDNSIEIGQHHYRNDKYTIFGGKQQLKVMDELENKYFFVPFHMGVKLSDAEKIGGLWMNFKR